MLEMKIWKTEISRKLNCPKLKISKIEISTMKISYNVGNKEIKQNIEN